MRSVAVISIAWSVVGVAACSGAAPSTLLEPPSGFGDDGAASGASSGASSGSGGSGDEFDATIDVEQGGPDDAAMSRDTGATVDAQAEASEGAASEGGVDPGIACGTGTYCMMGEFCCHTSTGPIGGMPQDRCVSQGNGCGNGIGNGGVAIRCDDTAECALGQVCCASVAIGGNFTGVSCQANACPASSFLASYQRLCDPNVNDCPAATPNCRPSTANAPYNVCGP